PRCREPKSAARLLLWRLLPAACAGSRRGGGRAGQAAGGQAAGGGAAAAMMPVQRLICFCRYFLWFTFRRDFTGRSSASLMLLEAESMKLSRSRVASLKSPASPPPPSYGEKAAGGEGGGGVRAGLAPALPASLPAARGPGWLHPPPRRPGREHRQRRGGRSIAPGLGHTRPGTERQRDRCAHTPRTGAHTHPGQVRRHPLTKHTQSPRSRCTASSRLHQSWPSSCSCSAGGKHVPLSGVRPGTCMALGARARRHAPALAAARIHTLKLICKGCFFPKLIAMHIT
uniref:Uncharacterized protein n=1 Tax=Catharus ustulatus TaxID=91951 RepID=A0A8C3TKJ5_CATUS